MSTIKNVIAAGLLLVLFLFGACAGGGMPAHDLEASAAEILTSYGEDEVAGNERFKDKWLKVNGLVGEIGEDLERGVDFALVSAEGFDFQGLQCYFKDAEELAQMTAGSEVTITGKCKGLRGFNIVLENCQVH